jgi:formamidopyrimidine-DNA glycosylase
MPELPEVETIVRGLRSHIVGLRIEKINVRYPGILRIDSRDFKNILTGAVISDIKRRGKNILVQTDRELTLVFHLKMTGQLLYMDSKEPLDKHTHNIFRFTGNTNELRHRDVRKFGYIDMGPSSEIMNRKYLARLGPEPLEITFAEFSKLLKTRNRRLKALLLDQDFLAGIGNIYADESLFMARLHPMRTGSSLEPNERRRLYNAFRRVLTRAIEMGGSSISDYRNLNGDVGGFQINHKAYGRRGLPCKRCGTPVIREQIAGRSTFFCPECQKL